MEYITHKKHDGTYQLLKEHMQNVAETAAAFAASFGTPMHAFRIGMLHDIGKYSEAGQARQRNPENTRPVDHATAGVLEALAQKDIPAAFTIAGHHGGLPNCGSRASIDDGTLMSRCKKRLINEMDPSAWRSELVVPKCESVPAWRREIPVASCGFADSMYIRMLFSCLVDADYLDTESFMRDGKVERGTFPDLAALLEKLKSYTLPWLDNPTSNINAVRSDVLRRCFRGGESARGFYSLTIPTGGGKTVASLAFALSHAVKHGLSRVIYVVPYTSIIEQNAQVFRNILGKDNVLEHHSGILFDSEDDDMLRLASENWDVPIVVTTAVQFFESLFASKPSKCRKLHNIASSVVIFDEAQMLPMPFMRPCVNAIAELVQHYRVTAILCTATQPCLDGLIREYAPNLSVREIVENTEELHAFFRRVRFCDDGSIELDALAKRLCGDRQFLCIVNSRKAAQRLYRWLPEEGSFHLSTLMTADHRSRILTEIRRRLREGLPCRVISTSLVEAGVDLDFPVVWREECGLDSILQAAGRCNREGKRPASESIVHVFRTEQKPPRMFEANIAALRRAVSRHADYDSPNAVRDYFETLMLARGDAALDMHGIIKMCNNAEFLNIDEAFHLIDSETIPVFIPREETADSLERLRRGEASRADMRMLGRHAVNVYPQHYALLRDAGMLETDGKERFGILLDMQQYSDKCGLQLEPETDTVWFC